MRDSPRRRKPKQQEISAGRPELPPERESEKITLLVDESATKKWQSFRTRFVSSVCMVGGFFVVLYFGHVFIWALVSLIQTVMVHELYKLAQKSRAEKDLPGFRFLQWYFFATMVFFVHGRFVRDNLQEEISQRVWKARWFGWLLANHLFVSYMLYIAGFVMFVVSLKKGHLLYQFGQFGWTHMILLVVLAQSSFFVANIFEGLFWFLLPVAVVVFNDVMAYISGFFFGRTPLIKLSPKKTWEGFIGAFISTMIFGFFFSRLLAQYSWMVCPKTDLTMRGWLECEPAAVFVDVEYPVESLVSHIHPESFAVFIRKMIPLDTVKMAPVQVHGVVLSAFASIIAPFGGFFASGFKRAFKIKDFGDSIPGHGGLTDRMDCQVVMAVFAYMYYNAYVKEVEVTIASILAQVQTLDPATRLELYYALGNMLVGAGKLNNTEVFWKGPLPELVNYSGGNGNVSSFSG